MQAAVSYFILCPSRTLYTIPFPSVNQFAKRDSILFYVVENSDIFTDEFVDIDRQSNLPKHLRPQPTKAVSCTSLILLL